MLVHLKDKGIKVKFPDGMDPKDVERVIYTQFYDQPVLHQGSEPSLWETVKERVSDLLSPPDPGVGPLTEADRQAFAPAPPEEQYPSPAPAAPRQAPQAPAPQVDDGFSALPEADWATTPISAEDLKRGAAYVPYLLTRALQGATHPLFAPLAGTRFDTNKLIADAADYWRRQIGESIEIPNIGGPPVQLADLLGSAADITGAMAPVSAASRAAGLVTEKALEGLARPFYRRIAQGMLTGALLGEGDPRKTLENAALFGVVDPLAYAVGQTPAAMERLAARMAMEKYGPRLQRAWESYTAPDIQYTKAEPPGALPAPEAGPAAKGPSAPQEPPVSRAAPIEAEPVARGGILRRFFGGGERAAAPEYEAELQRLEAKYQRAEPPPETEPPRALPEPQETPAHYFQATERSREVPLDKLLPREAPPPDKLDRARKLMDQAKAGAGPKRKPIKVLDRGDGTYSVLDGNTTLHVLKERGAPSAVVEVKKTLKQPIGRAGKLSDVYRMADEAKHDFVGTVRAWANQVGGLPTFRAKEGVPIVLKGKQRAAQKAIEDKTPASVKDILGGTIVFRTPEEMMRGFQQIKNDPRIVKIKDRASQITDPLGYGDIQTFVRMPNGHIGELQFNTEAMIAAKEGLGHLFYEISRDIYGKYRGREMPQDVRQFLESVERVSNKYYDLARQSDSAHSFANSLASSSEMNREIREIMRMALSESSISESLSESTLNSLLAKSKESPSFRSSAAKGTSSTVSKNTIGMLPPPVSGEGPITPAHTITTPTEPVNREIEQNVRKSGGRETRIFTPSSPTEGIPARYAVVEAADVIPSHNAASFSKRPDYPAGVQERQYHTDKAEQLKVIQQAQQLNPAFVVSDNPDAINGPPIVTPDGVVLGGNSRAMAIQRAYLQHPERAEAYRQALVDQAVRYGLDPEQIRGMNAPVLVRVVEQPPGTTEELHRLASEFNAPMTGAMGIEAQTASLGKNVSPETIRWVAAQLQARDVTLRKLLDDPKAGKELLNRLASDRAIPERRMGELVSQRRGVLTHRGKEVIEQTVLGFLIDDADLLEVAPRSALATISRALPNLAKVEVGGPEWSLKKPLQDALDILTIARGRGAKVTDITRQLSITGAQFNPKAVALARMIEEAGQKEINAAIAKYAMDARVTAGGQMTITKPRTPDESFSKWFGKWTPPAAGPAMAQDKPKPYGTQLGISGLSRPVQLNMWHQLKQKAGSRKPVKVATASAAAASRKAPRTIAKMFRDDLLKNESISLVGKRVADAHELAHVAQVLRDPRWESFHIIYEKDGVVIGQETVSCRLPGSTHAFVGNFDEFYKRVLARAVTTGADGIYLLHNHPSGVPQPSNNDIVLTKLIADKLYPLFKHHVVIDSGQYAVIWGHGEFDIDYLRLPLGWKDPILQPQVKLEALDRGAQVLNSSERVALVGKMIHDSLTGDDPIVIYLSPGLHIRGVQVVPRDLLIRRKPEEVQQWMLERLREFGSTRAAVVESPAGSLRLPAAALQRYHRLVKDGVLLDAVYLEEPTERRSAPYLSALEHYGIPQKLGDHIAGISTSDFDARLMSDAPELFKDLAGDTLGVLAAAEESAEYRSTRTSRLAHYFNWLRGRHGQTEIYLHRRYAPQIGYWFRNMESILSQTPETRRIYEAGRAFKIDTIRMYSRWKARYDEAVKGLTAREKRAVLNILDSTEEITGDHPIERRAAALRALLRDVREYMVQHGVPVGYLEGYLPHIFQGKYWVNVEGEPSHKVGTLGEALELAEKLAAEGKKVRVMQDAFIPFDDAGTALTRRAYWRLVKRLEETFAEPGPMGGRAVPVMEDLDKDQIREMLRGVARPATKRRFFGNLRERVVNNPHFIKDLDRIFHLYLYGAARKVHQDILWKIVQRELERMPPGAQRLKKFVEDVFMPGVLAHPTNFEEGVAIALHRLAPAATGQDVRRWIHNINLPQYVMDLGLSVSSAIANGTQFMINAYPIVGELSAVRGYSRALRTLRDPKLLQEIEDAGILTGVSSVTGEIMVGKGAILDTLRKIVGLEGVKGMAEASLVPFSAVEAFNRMAAYWAGKDYALRMLRRGVKPTKLAGKVAPETSSLHEMARKLEAKKRIRPADHEQFARAFGFELNDKTNFRVGRENLPMVLREAPVRLLSPYKSFLLNQLKYTAETLSPLGVARDPLKALRFLAATIILGGVAANPAIKLMFDAADALHKKLTGRSMEKWLKAHDLWRGVFGRLGFDISGSVAIILPTKVEDLLGRFGKLGLDLGRFIRQSVAGEGTIFTERKLKRLAQPALVQRVLDAMEIVRTGMYHTPITQTPVALDDSPAVAAVKRIVGIMPAGVGKAFEQEEERRKLIDRYQSLSRDMTERWASAVKSGDEAAMDRVMERVVNEINQALETMANPNVTEDEAAQAMTQLMFWSHWAANQTKFENALARKLTPMQVERLRRAPKYLAPQLME